MNYDQADKAMPSASRVVEVLEGLGEKECPQCLEGPSTPPCPACNDTGKVKWKWEPKHDDYFVTEKGIIERVPRHFELDRNMLVVHSDRPELHPMSYLMEDITFIPHWEDDIEPALEKAGYRLIGLDRGEGRKFHCDIMRENCLVVATVGKDRQEAVMLAVDALGKGL